MVGLEELLAGIEIEWTKFEGFLVIIQAT